jgi:hypothetical protein
MLAEFAEVVPKSGRRRTSQQTLDTIETMLMNRNRQLAGQVAPSTTTGLIGGQGKASMDADVGPFAKGRLVDGPFTGMKVAMKNSRCCLVPSPSFNATDLSAQSTAFCDRSDQAKMASDIEKHGPKR